MSSDQSRAQGHLYRPVATPSRRAAPGLGPHTLPQADDDTDFCPKPAPQRANPYLWGNNIVISPDITSYMNQARQVSGSLDTWSNFLFPLCQFLSRAHKTGGDRHKNCV